MYERHQEYFKNEWEYIHAENKYGCYIRIDAINIMYAFEHSLYALQLANKNTTKAEIIALYENHIRVIYEFIYKNPEDMSRIYAHCKEQDAKLHYFSPYFKRLRMMGFSWAAYDPGFGFYTVFLEELEDYIIEKVLTVDANLFKKLSSEDFESFYEGHKILDHITHMRHRGSREFEKVLETVFNELVKSSRFIAVVQYAQHNKEVSSEFIKFLLDQLYTHEHFKRDLEIQEYFTGFIGFILNTHTRPVIKEYLMERIEAIKQEDRLRTWSYLVYFTNEPEVLQLMLDKSNQKNISPEESKILANNFKRMLKAEDFPEESKKLIDKQFKKSRYDTKK